MAESDASESSVLVDLSDRIDAELSEAGDTDSICQAESVPVQPYRCEPYRLDSDEEATENDQPGGAEAGRYGEKRSRKKILTHSLIWRPSRVADTPPLLPISRYGYCLFVADVCLCSEVLQPGGSRSSSGSGSM